MILKVKKRKETEMKDFSNLKTYSEYPNFAAAQPQRTEYLEGLNSLIAKLRKDSAAKREEYMRLSTLRVLLRLSGLTFSI